jgi:hypothetical protein
MDPAIQKGLKVSFLIVAVMMAATLGTSLALSIYDPRLKFASRLAPHFGYVQGHHCALCGMTHSFVACSRGDFRAALVANPMGPLTYVLFLLATTVGLATILRDWTMCCRVRRSRQRESP